MKYLAQNVGPKDRTQSYKDSVTRLLQLSKPKHIARDKQYIVSVNSINTGPTVKLVSLDFDAFTVSALVDTGSTHCLISAEQYQQLSSIPYIPLKLHMKVAGHTLKDNVIGKAQLPVKFKTVSGDSLILFLEFLIAHALNGYDAIIGADFLMNEEILAAITPTVLL